MERVETQRICDIISHMIETFSPSPLSFRSTLTLFLPPTLPAQTNRITNTSTSTSILTLPPIISITTILTPTLTLTLSPSLPPYHHSHYCHRNKQNTQNKVQAALRSKLDEAISVKRSQVETVSPWAFVAFFRYLAMVQVM